MKVKKINPSLFKYDIKELKSNNDLKNIMSTLPNIDNMQSKEELLNLQSAALEAAANGIVITDAEGKTVWVNSAFTKLTGYSKVEVYGKNPRLLKSGEHNDQFYKDLWDTIKAGNIWEGTIINKKKNGDFYHEEMTITPVKNSAGKITNFVAIKHDVTNRKKAEKDIKYQNKLLNDILESITHPFYVINAEDYSIEIGNSASNLINSPFKTACYAHTHKLNEPCSDLDHPCPLKIVKETKKSTVVEHKHYDKNGKQIYVEVHGYPLLDENGEVVKIIEYSIDITKRKLIEMELRENQYKFKQLVENSTLGIMRLDPEGKIIMVNPATVSLLGYSTEAEIILLSDDKIYYKLKNKIKFLEILKNKQKVHAFEDIFIKKDGSLINVQINAWTIKDKNDNVIYYEMIVEDITEQNQILKILHESEYKYRILIDKLSEAVYLLIERKFEIVNSKFLDLLEITEEELYSPGFNMLDFISEESKKMVIEREIKVARGEKVPLKYEMGLVTKNGNEKEVEVSVTYLNFNGKTGAQGVIRDLTEIKKNETQIRHLQKMEAIGTLAAGIAHEINTPSQFVNDNLSFLKEAYNDFEPVYKFLNKLKQNKADLNELKQIVKEIDIEFLQEELPVAINQSLEGVQRIAKIVGAMRDFSHSGPREKTSADLHKLIENSITISSNAWKYIANIERDFDDNLPPIVCQASDLGQVIVNMIVNASHALEDKFKNSATIKGLIQIKTIKKENFVEIVISDNGTGMPEKVKKRIFDPFFTTKDVGKGTGQGLTIAYDIIVDKHNGSIEVESEENVGTKFTITLPIDNIKSSPEQTSKGTI